MHAYVCERATLPCVVSFYSLCLIHMLYCVCICTAHVQHTVSIPCAHHLLSGSYTAYFCSACCHTIVWLHAVMCFVLPAAALRKMPWAAGAGLLLLFVSAAVLQDQLSTLAWTKGLRRLHSGFNSAAYMDSPAKVKAPLSSIFGSALMPLLDVENINTY
ncbi:hypothetical protein ABBQ32_012444 [Trebouxia sp. C0010 RCD-2024]